VKFGEIGSYIEELQILTEKEIIKKFKSFFKYNHSKIDKKIKQNNIILKHLKTFNLNENNSYEQESILINDLIVISSNIKAIYRLILNEKNKIIINENIYNETKSFPTILEYIKNKKVILNELDSFNIQLKNQYKKLLLYINKITVIYDVMRDIIADDFYNEFRIRVNNWSEVFDFFRVQYYKSNIIPIFSLLEKTIYFHKLFFDKLKTYNNSWKIKKSYK
jgi:hypothetical protein